MRFKEFQIFFSPPTAVTFNLKILQKLHSFNEHIESEPQTCFTPHLLGFQALSFSRFKASHTACNVLELQQPFILRVESLGYLS